MENPFKFEDPKNPRVVTNSVIDWNKIYGGSAFLWAGSLAWYQRKYFRVNNNAVYLLAFTAFSLPASYGYAKFMLASAEDEAAAINNQAEG
tara:strand:+ start:27 stop:299 length:273 start_codon:yes stop_codon:yes gene_type:complete